MHLNYVNIVFFVGLLSLKNSLSYRLPLEEFQDILREHEHDNIDSFEDTMKDLPQDGELFEGDMRMDDRLRNAVLGIKRTAISDDDLRWPDGVIVYENNIQNDRGKQLLDKAMREFRKRTCISFRKRTTEKDYVVYTDEEDYCASNVGRIGGKQTINLGKHCDVLGTFQHETMHALGFIHEHARPDRDEHVDVHFENVEKKEFPNFNKYSMHDVINIEKEPYNFASVMHYRNDAFTSNGKDTIVAKNDPSLKFGQRIKFSVGDVKEINRLYGCSGQNDNYIGLYKTFDEKMLQRRKDKRMNNRHSYGAI